MTQQFTAIDSAAAIRELGTRLTGKLIQPGDPEYDAAREVHFIQYDDRRPALIVRAATANDVAEAVRFARANALEIAVRSGGHSIPGYSMPDGTVVIDVSAMKLIEVDAELGRVKAQSGLTSGELAPVLNQHGFALTTGDAGTVGLGGLVTGGGVGFMVRKYGLAIDHMVSAEVVTADGEIVRASETSHPDLFWAIRGGGGNFGIITEFEFAVPRVDTVYGGMLVLPATPDVVRGYFDYAIDAPEELTTIAMVMKAPPAPFVAPERVGELALVIFIVHTDVESGERDVAPLRALSDNAIADMVSPIPYPAIYEFTEPATVRHSGSLRSGFVQEFSDELIEKMLAKADVTPSPFGMLQLRPLGGQYARVAPDATAFPHRDRRFLVAVLGLYEEELSDAKDVEDWMLSIWEDIRPAASGVYSNFLADEGPERVKEAYGEANYRRLARVKQQYDPENVFRFNQNIPARLDEEDDAAA
jgi:FAD/FMN-containing dehydrogenase